jgi:hypothetical protein
MGQFGNLGLLQQVDGGLTATCPVVSRHEDGSLIIQDGLAIMSTEEGPVAMNFRSAWQRPDAKFLSEALKRAEWVEEENIPVPTPRQGYRLGVTTLGCIAKLSAEDAAAMASELSVARYTDETGNVTEVNGVIAITGRALNALGLSKIPMSFEKRATKPVDVANLAESVAYVREHGAVPYSVTFANGDELKSFGFPRGNQRASVIETRQQQLEASSVLSKVNTGTVIRAQAPTGNAAQAAAQRNRRPAPAVTY